MVGPMLDKFRSGGGEPVAEPLQARPVRNRASIVEPEGLAAALNAVVDEHGPDGVGLRPALLSTLQVALAEGRAEIERRFL